MRRLFYVLLIIPMLNAMEIEKDKQEESPETARLFTLSPEELMREAISYYEKAEKLYKEALAEKKQPDRFEGSKYQTAERYCYEANKYYAAAANKGYAGASSLTQVIQNQIHEIEKKKLELSEFYALSQGFTKSIRRTELITQSSAAKESITWQQALKETNLENIKEHLKKAKEEKTKEASEKEELAKKEKEATEKALQEATKEKIKEQFKKNA